ncbi:hypothetical protein C8R43DRAFT_1102646 [Mycena crocata]|nr:hypothetical protein C8R43DRAFT_1102646 [Mycena crocata]
MSAVEGIAYQSQSGLPSQNFGKRLPYLRMLVREGRSRFLSHYVVEFKNRKEQRQKALLFAQTDSTPTAGRTAPSRNFTHLLKSNELPFGFEISAIRQVISDGQEFVNALEAQIQDVQDVNVLAGLIQKRNETADSVRLHRAAVSPLRRVPPELICEILALSTEGNSSPPWHLGHISRFWRQAAISFGHLWSYIHLRSSADYISKMPILEHQLLRSANASLTVNFDDYEVQPPVLALLLQSFERWTSVRIFRRSLDSVDDILGRAGGQFTRLKRLEIVGGGPDSPEIIHNFRAPNLREAVLTESVLRIDYSSAIHIPWHQLTLYRGTYAPQRQLEILQAMPNLRECTLAFVNFARSPRSTSVSVILPHLRRLYLEEERFLIQLTTPALTDLFLFCPGLHTVSSLMHFESPSQLTKLVFMGDYRGSSGDILAVLRALPALKSFAMMGGLGGGLAEQVLFRGMTVTNTSDDLSPNLTSFLYGIYLMHQFPADEFVSMIQSRLEQTASSRLAFVRIWGTGLGSATDPTDSLAAQILTAQIQIWRDEGLDAAWGRDDAFEEPLSGAWRWNISMCFNATGFNFDPNTPISETMQALHDLDKAGHVRYIGMSSCCTWQCKLNLFRHSTLLDYSDSFQSMQCKNYYSLVYREEEREMFPTLKHFGAGSIPWFPPSRGALTRPFSQQQTKRGSSDPWSANSFTQSTAGQAIVNRVEEIVKKRGISTAQVAIAWIPSKDGVSALIVGSTSLDNLAIIGTIHVQLTEEEIKTLEAWRNRTSLWRIAIFGH